MELHLTIISYPRKMDSVFESIVFNCQERGAQPEQAVRHRFARCQEPEQLFELVMRYGRDLTRLDLVGHGSPTRFWLGDETPLLDLNANPHPVLGELAGVLPADVEVRILGCLTGVGQEGLSLLKSTSAALGGRQVTGTTARVEADDFGPEGLIQDFRTLHSSREAGFAPPHVGTTPDGEPTPLAGQQLDSDSRVDSDLEALRQWKQLFPPGFEPLGRGRPLARPDLSLFHQGVPVTFACDYRLVMIQDSLTKAPLLMGWSHPEPVPVNETLTQSLKDNSPLNQLFPVESRATPRISKPAIRNKVLKTARAR
ncbi:hypothetical protein LY474_00720 [Myxococcus stipitatus]|uniref:hypothetical protein n=1 Tax=Myxococcus stipitatus TaxID=83455 RepID=UPI001F316CC7|nr:hypothetical protein [Myxococcus stipitatus]MCE9666321.1 hypothetical protein [Myxococcus stipitatus]